MGTVFAELPEPPAEYVTEIQSGLFSAIWEAMRYASSSGISPLGGKISNESVCPAASLSVILMTPQSHPPVYEMATEKSACHWHSPRLRRA